MNEDLVFGYLACAAGVPIDPLPVLEAADSPSSAADVIRQAALVAAAGPPEPEQPDSFDHHDR